MPRSTLFGLMAVALFLIVVALHPVEAHLAGLTLVDDGFYYLGYARQLALGQGPTFDGLVPTNGVQPLWALLLTGLALLVNTPVGLLQAALILATGLVIVSGIAVYHALRRIFEPRVAGTALFFYLALIATPQIVLTGMETPANLATLSLALAAVLAIRREALWPTLGAGVLLGLACLARVDNLILTPAFALLLAWSNGSLSAAVQTRPRRWTPLLRSTVYLALPVILIFGGYVLFNLAAFGRALPISGDVKSTLHALQAAPLGGRFSPAYLWQATLEALAQIPTILNYYLTTLLIAFSPWTLLARLILVLGLGGLAVWLIRRLRRARPAPLAGIPPADRLAILGVAGVVLGHVWLFHFQLGAQYAFLNWYYAPEYVFITFALGLLLRGLGQVLGNPQPLHRVLQGWLIGSLAVSGLVFGGQFTARSNPLQPLLTPYLAVTWANEHLPPQAVIGSFNAGVVGYFSTQPVINLDGLMNDADMLAVIQGERDLVDYLERHGIAWIMDYTAGTWSPADGQPFRNIPAARLEVAYALPFTNYNFVASTFYVLRFR